MPPAGSTGGGDDLIFGPVGRLGPGHPIDVIGSRNSLETVHPPALFHELIDGPWHKANDFQSSYLPDIMTFDADGTASFVYRDGDCDHSATWSVFRSTNRDKSWQLAYSPRLCDVRGESDEPLTAPTASKVAFSNDILMLRQPYLRKKSSAQLVVFDQNGLSIRGEIAGPIVAGKAVEGHLDIRPSLPQSVSLERLVITFQSMRLTSGRFEYFGDPQVVAEHELAGTALTRRDSTTVSMRLTPDENVEWARLRLEIEGDVNVRQSVVVRVHK